MFVIPDDLNPELRQRFERFLKNRPKNISMERYIERALIEFIDRHDEINRTIENVSSSPRIF